MSGQTPAGCRRCELRRKIKRAERLCVSVSHPKLELKPTKDGLLMRFSSKMLFGDSMLRRAAAASFVSMLSSAPETAVSVRQKRTPMNIRKSCESVGVFG